MSSRKKSGAKKGKKKSGTRLVNLGDLGPDALATFDAANESSNAAEDDDDEDDEDAVLHPVSQMMFPLDETEALLDDEEEYPEEVLSEPLLALAKARILSIWIALVQDSPQSSFSSSRVSAAAGYGALMSPELHSKMHMEMLHLGMANSTSDAASMLCSVSRRLSDQGMLDDKELADLTVWQRNMRMNESRHGSWERADSGGYEEVLTMIEWVRRRIHPPNDEDESGEDDAASDELDDVEKLRGEECTDSWALSSLPPGSEVEMQTAPSSGSEAAWNRLEVGALAKKSSNEDLAQSSSSSRSSSKRNGRASSAKGMGNGWLGTSSFPQGTSGGGGSSDGALAGASRALTVLCRAATVYQTWQSPEVQALRQRMENQQERRENGDTSRLRAASSGGSGSSMRSRNSSSSSGKGRSSDGKDDGEYDPEVEIGRAIKRVCYKEACHLLSPPEVSLLLCWLGDDDNRDRKAKIAELEPALQQVEAWAPEILQLIQSPPFIDHRSLVMSVVKTAHWHLVKMWEFEGEYAKAIAAQVTLKASTLVECQPEELRIVEAAARQYRWTELKERGEELFAEGQYTACRALHEQALASPDLFLANTNHKAVSEQVIRNCQHQAKHDLRRSKAPSHQTAASQAQHQQSGVAKLAQHLKDRAAASSEHALDDSAAARAALAAQAEAAAASKASCAATVAFASALSHQDLRRELRLGSDLNYQDGSATALTTSTDGSEVAVAGSSGSGSGGSSGGGGVDAASGLAISTEVNQSTSSSKGPGSGNKKAPKHGLKGSGGKNGWGLHSSNHRRGHSSKSWLDNHAASVASAVVNLEAKGASLASNLEALHDCLSPEMRAAAVLRPSLTQHSFADRLRESWPCQQTISELVHGQPTRVQVYECLTCRGVGGAGGRLHLICDLCRRVKHSSRGHRLRPLGTAFECDDSACASPWCPEFRVRTVLPSSYENGGSEPANSSSRSGSSSVDKPNNGDTKANSSSGGVKSTGKSRLFSAARGESFEAATQPDAVTSAGGAPIGTSNDVTPSPNANADDSSAMLRMVAPLNDGSKIELSLEMPCGPAATTKYLTELLQKAEYAEALDECILANQADKHEKLEKWTVNWIERWNAKKAELKRAEAAAAAHAEIYDNVARTDRKSDRSNLRRRKPAKDALDDDSAPAGYVPLSDGSDEAPVSNESRKNSTRSGEGDNDDDEDESTGKSLYASQQVLATHRWATGASEEASSPSLEPVTASTDNDDVEEGDALESGRFPGHGRGVSEVERDVVRLRELLREMEQSLVNDLSEMHVDMVLLKALYRQAALAKIAKALRRKLEASRGRSEDQMARAATLAAEQEAEDAMRALELEEVNSSKANSKGTSKGGNKGHHQKSGGAKGSSSSGGDAGGGGALGSGGDGTEGGSTSENNPIESSAAPKKLTKKQKEKEKARQKREEDEAKAAAAEAQRAAKLSEAQAQRENDRREALRAAQAAREKEEQAVLSAQREARLAAEKALAEEEERMVAEALAASEELARVAAEQEKEEQAAAASAAAAAQAKEKKDREEAARRKKLSEEKEKERKVVEADKAKALLAIEKARAVERAAKNKAASAAARNTSAASKVPAKKSVISNTEDEEEEEEGFTVSFGDEVGDDDNDEDASPPVASSTKMKRNSGKAASSDDDGETESEASIAEASVSDNGEPSRSSSSSSRQQKNTSAAAARRMRPDAPTFQPTMAAAATPVPSYLPHPQHHPYMYPQGAGGPNGMYPLGPGNHGMNGPDHIGGGGGGPMAQGMMPPMYFVPPPGMDPSAYHHHQGAAAAGAGGPAGHPQFHAANFQQLVHAYGLPQAQQMMQQMQQQQQYQIQQEQQDDDEGEEDEDDEEEDNGEEGEEGEDGAGEPSPVSLVEAPTTTNQGTTAAPSTSTAEAQLRQMLALPPTSNANSSAQPPPQPANADSEPPAAAVADISPAVTSEQQQQKSPSPQPPQQRTAAVVAGEGGAAASLSPAEKSRPAQLQALVKKLCGGKRLSDSVALALFRLPGFKAKFTAAVAAATTSTGKQGTMSAAAVVAGGSSAQNPLATALLAAFTEMSKVESSAQAAPEAKGGASGGKGSGGGKNKGSSSSSASAVATPSATPLAPSTALATSLNALAAAAEASGWCELSTKSSSLDAPLSCASFLAQLDKASASRGCVREAFGVNLVSAFPVLGAVAATPHSSPPFVATAALSALAAAAKSSTTTGAAMSRKGGAKPPNEAAAASAPSFEACWRAAYPPWKGAAGVDRKPEVVALGFNWDTNAGGGGSGAAAGSGTSVAEVWTKWVPPLLNLSRLLDPPPPGQASSPPAGGSVLGQANLRAVVCAAGDGSAGGGSGGFVVMAQKPPTHRGFSTSTWVACAGVRGRGSKEGEKSAAAVSDISSSGSLCPAAAEVGSLAAVKELATALKLKPLVLLYEVAPQPPAAAGAATTTASGSGNSSSRQGKGGGGGKGSTRHHGAPRGGGGGGGSSRGGS